MISLKQLVIEPLRWSILALILEYQVMLNEQCSHLGLEGLGRYPLKISRYWLKCNSDHLGVAVLP